MEIFSISALDLFASALGAFILVTMILFPYYGRGRAAADPASAMQASPGETRARADQPSIAGPSFLLVQIRWLVPGADIDLHVTDPAGREFYWYKANRGGGDYAGSEATLSYDMTSGPAVELWQSTTPEPGTYQIEYVANALPDGVGVEVVGTVFEPKGRHDLAVRKLNDVKRRVLVATIQVDQGGHVALR
ncbi:hypothetical protein [Methylobacterium sp. OAE515]|uniref:hypothetical protein n=1 Tax=Methylobacterium sp. OAE515 TaxID=2817895 RepID=UPI001789C824